MQAAQNPESAPAVAGADVSTTVYVGGEPHTIERLSGRKSSRVLAVMRAITDKVPKIITAGTEFRIAYEREHYDEFDRVQLRMQYPAKLLVDGNGEPIREPATFDDGTPNPKAGEQVWAPSIADQITEAEWAASGEVFRQPREASDAEVSAHLFALIIEHAEDDLYRLLALFLMSNAEVAEAWKSGNWNDVLQKRADDLLDTCWGDELLELAVACSERVDDQFVRKARGLGNRLGNLGRLVGLTTSEPTTAPTAREPEETTPTTLDEPTDTPSSSTPNSSTPSPAATDGLPTPSSTLPGTSSTSYSDESEETKTSEPPAQTSPAQPPMEASPA